MKSAFSPARDIPPLAGKVILITGANAGIGKEAALALAKHDPSQLWIAARNPQTGNAAVNEIKKIAPNVTTRFLPLDLGSFDSIKAAARTVLTDTKRLDILILNAGMFGGPVGVTKEGYEMRFGTNHVGHALFLKLLTPLLLKTAADPVGVEPRVIFVSSSGHKYVPKIGIAFDDLKSKGGSYSIPDWYCMSKMANLLYAREVATRYPQFTTVSVDPGNVKTDLFAPDAGLKMWIISRFLLPLIGASPEEGAKNHLWAATAKDVVTGTHYEPVGVGGNESDMAKDDKLSQKLWEWTEKELKAEDI